MEQCVFKLDNGNICVGKCRYFEHGDSELIEMYGRELSSLVHTYRNWELHNFDRTKYFTVTHWASLQLQLAGVSLRSFNQKIESYEIALKYSEELKEYDRVYTLTIKLAALRLAKSDFFPMAKGL